jgi:hypothetical protein
MPEDRTLHSELKIQQQKYFLSKIYEVLVIERDTLNCELVMAYEKQGLAVQRCGIWCDTNSSNVDHSTCQS